MSTALEDIYGQSLQKGLMLPDSDQKRAVEMLARLGTSLEKPVRGFLPFFKKPQKPIKGIYLYGGVGRGKSMIMDMFFDSLKTSRKRRVHFHAFMLSVHDFLHDLRSKRKKGDADKIDGDLMACADKIAQESDIVCFDEFQVRDVADAMILGRLFTALFERGVFIVMTSNIAPDNLYEDGLQRDRFLPFIGLLKEKMDIVEFTGNRDYRLGRLRDLNVYFWPDDADARRELDNVFRTMADGAAGETADITVKGRIIHVPRAAKEVCFFTFSALCEEHKSALDYLELVKHFRVFILEGVPLLDDGRRNAVVRFVTLVDTLYDHHAVLVMSAAASPERLYAGGESDGIFPRTVSRLMEMQSREYKNL